MILQTRVDEGVLPVIILLFELIMKMGREFEFGTIYREQSGRKVKCDIVQLSNVTDARVG